MFDSLPDLVDGIRIRLTESLLEAATQRSAMMELLIEKGVFTLEELEAKIPSARAACDQRWEQNKARAREGDDGR